MSSQRMSGTAVQRTIAVLGSAVFFVVAPCTLAGLVPWSITGWQLRPPFLGLELTRGIGAIMILAGVPGLVDAFARFALQGLGTPAPIAPTRNLVVTGLYRYVRNPIYVAVVAIILGQAVLMGDWRLIVYGALLWLAFHVFVVAYEEPTLKGTFGREYEAFRAAVANRHHLTENGLVGRFAMTALGPAAGIATLAGMEPGGTGRNAEAGLVRGCGPISHRRVVQRAKSTSRHRGCIGVCH